jgi:hypothetical protein
MVGRLVGCLLAWGAYMGWMYEKGGSGFVIFFLFFYLFYGIAIGRWATLEIGGQELGCGTGQHSGKKTM